MSRALEMDDLEKSLIEVRRGDHVRNTLLDDLFRKLDDMQKTMDRNAFTMVLIDGDCTLFLNELVKKGIAGGDEAAKLLRRAVFDYLRNDPNFKHDHKIIVRIYANLRGLNRTYIEKGILPNTTVFTEFVLGFNKAHPLCDFIDAGNHKEAADSKLKENLNLYIYNVHCKQIIFGASADNGYASFLSSIYDTDISSRIKLLKSLPFAFEFTSILSKLQWTEFTNIFRSEFLKDVAEERHVRQSHGLDQSREQESKLNNIHGAAVPWRSKIPPVSEASSAPVNENARLKSWNSTIGLGSERQGRRDRIKYDSDSEDEPAGSALPSLTDTVLPPSSRGTPSTIEVETALIDCVNTRLDSSPLSLDFGTVKRDVEIRLGLSSDFWGRSERDEWFQKSKNVMKRAVENWMERTGNPPPKNATWLRQHFAHPSKFPRPASQNSSSPEKPLSGDKLISEIRNHRLIDQEGVARIFRNANHQRVDYPETWSVHPFLVNAVRNREPRLCNQYHLNGDCMHGSCPYDHDSELSDAEFAALLHVSRSQICPQGSACDALSCIKGHMCPNGRNCKHGHSCRFARLHGMDTTAVHQDQPTSVEPRPPSRQTASPPSDEDNVNPFGSLTPLEQKSPVRVASPTE